LAITTACSEPAGLSAIEFNSLELTVRPTRAAVPAGDTVFVEVVARNHSTVPIDLNRGACGPLEFELRNEAGTRVGSSFRGACGYLNSAPSFRVEGLDSLVIGRVWRVTSQMNAMLAPGAYTLIGGLVRPDDSHRFEKAGNPVPLTILPVNVRP